MCPQIQSIKQSKKGKFPSNYKASPIDLKRKFRSVDKPLQKGPLKNISTEAYFGNFTVYWLHVFRIPSIHFIHLAKVNVIAISSNVRKPTMTSNK